MNPHVTTPPKVTIELGLEEMASLRAFAGTPMHEAQTFPHLPSDLQAIALKLEGLGLVHIVNNTVVATEAGREILRGHHEQPAI